MAGCGGSESWHWLAPSVELRARRQVVGGFMQAGQWLSPRGVSRQNTRRAPRRLIAPNLEHLLEPLTSFPALTL